MNRCVDSFIDCFLHNSDIKYNHDLIKLVIFVKKKKKNVLMWYVEMSFEHAQVVYGVPLIVSVRATVLFNERDTKQS